VDDRAEQTPVDGKTSDVGGSQRAGFNELNRGGYLGQLCTPGSLLHGTEKKAELVALGIRENDPGSVGRLADIDSLRPQVEEPPHLFVLSRSVCPQVKVNPILDDLLVSNSSDLEPKELDGLPRAHQTCGMEPRLTLISLVVRDLVVSRRFYIDGLGWPIEFEVPEEVVMVRLVPGVVLSLWQEDKAKGELGTIGRTPDALPFALAHNVGSEAEVDAALDEASAVGASIPTPAIRRDWGGYSGYFVDPDGFRWEVAYNPGL
jgi:predicted lactoylglutathione lyase